MEAPASRCHAPNRATLMGHAGAQGTATLVLPAVPLPTPRSAGTGLPWALCGPAHSPSPPAAAPYSRGPAVPAAPCPPERPGPAGRGGCGGGEAGRHGRTGPANPTLSVPLFLVSDSKAAAVFPPGGSQATSVGPPGLRPQPGPALHEGGRKAWTRGRDAGTGAQGRGWGRRPGREAGRGQRHVPAGCLPLLPASHSLLVPQTPYPSQPLALPRRVSPALPTPPQPPAPPARGRRTALLPRRGGAARPPPDGAAGPPCTVPLSMVPRSQLLPLPGRSFSSGGGRQDGECWRQRVWFHLLPSAPAVACSARPRRWPLWWVFGRWLGRVRAAWGGPRPGMVGQGLPWGRGRAAGLRLAAPGRGRSRSAPSRVFSSLRGSWPC